MVYVLTLAGYDPFSRWYPTATMGCQWRPFVTWDCECHMTMRQCYCDVIFINCSCQCKLEIRLHHRCLYCTFFKLKQYYTRFDFNCIKHNMVRITKTLNADPDLTLAVLQREIHEYFITFAIFLLHQRFNIGYDYQNVMTASKIFGQPLFIYRHCHMIHVFSYHNVLPASWHLTQNWPDAHRYFYNDELISQRWEFNHRWTQCNIS